MCLVHQPSISPAWSTFSGFAFRGSKEHPPALALRLRPGPRDGWVLILVPEFHDFKWQNQGFRWKKHIFSAIRSPASGFWLNLFQSAGSPSVVTQLIIEQVRMVSLMPFTQVVSQFRWRAKELLRISQPRDMSFYHIIWSLWYPYNWKKIRIDYQG